MDQAVLFRKAHELVGRDHAALGVVPAHQRLTRADAVARHGIERLEVQRQRIARNGRAQLVAQARAGLDFIAQVGIKELEAVAPERLGAIERNIGMLEKDLGTVAILRSTARHRYWRQ